MSDATTITHGNRRAGARVAVVEMTAPDLLVRADDLSEGCDCGSPDDCECVSSAQDEVIRDLAAALRAVRALHGPVLCEWCPGEPDPAHSVCRSCAGPRNHPCDTARILAEHGVAVES